MMIKRLSFSANLRTLIPGKNRTAKLDTKDYLGSLIQLSRPEGLKGPKTTNKTGVSGCKISLTKTGSRTT